MRNVKELLRRVLDTAFGKLHPLVSRTVGPGVAVLSDLERRGSFHRVDQGTQILLSLKYHEMIRNEVKLPSFDDVEFRSYSQNGEDGILLFIFSLIGTTNKKVVEICAGTGIECNAANLIINRGWQGLLFDGSPENIAIGKKFYSKHKDTWFNPPILVSGWITRDNVNALIASHGFSGDIDLLSIDIDGNDYWIWEAIECIRPRVVVVEYNSMWSVDRAVTIPYREDFVAEFVDGVPEYAGASLPAFVKLGKKKGYRLVGCQRLSFNAFFVRNEIGGGILPEVAAEQCLGDWLKSEAYKARIQRLSKRECIDI